MRKRILLLVGLSIVSAIALLGCMDSSRVGRTTPTPTKTPRPLHTATLTLAPSDTPVPPTDTPLPTDTPVPPTDTPPPTDTAVPTEAPPTDTAVVPTDVPPSDTPAPPTNTPQPKASNTPVPPTNTPKPKVDFRIAEVVAFVEGSTGASGGHNVYFTVVDAGGAPIDGVVIEEINNEPHLQMISGEKGPGKTEFIMWAADYRFKVVGNNSGQAFSSEETHVLSIVFGHAVWDDLIRGGVCATVAECEAMGQSHYSYNVTFQRTR
jgi:hypothetical protein